MPSKVKKPSHADLIYSNAQMGQIKMIKSNSKKNQIGGRKFFKRIIDPSKVEEIKLDKMHDPKQSVHDLSIIEFTENQIKPELDDIK